MNTSFSHFPNEVSGICTLCGNDCQTNFDLCGKCYNEYQRVETPTWLRSVLTETNRRRRQLHRDIEAGLVSLDHITETLYNERKL